MLLMDNVREDLKVNTIENNQDWEATKHKIEEFCESLVVGYVDGAGKKKDRYRRRNPLAKPDA